MRLLQRKPIVLALLFVALAGLLIVGWQVGSVFYSGWVEHRRIDDLTQRYDDDLLEAVERYRIALAVSRYARRDELDQYATGSALSSLWRTWDEEIQTGKSVVVLTSLDYASTRVLSYTESKASLLILVRWKEAVYGPNGLKSVDRRTAGGSGTFYNSRMAYGK